MSEHDLPNRNQHDDEALVQSPPTTVLGILQRLGPGLIVAASIVGSGELIATTAVGAEAGFWLLWLILIGCVIKVFVQVEIGRYTISNGRTALDGLTVVPGPRMGKTNWLLWCWLVMFLTSIGQLGGIVGGVGQALAISMPITSAGKQYNEAVDAKIKMRIELQQLLHADKGSEADEDRAARIAELQTEIAAVEEGDALKQLEDQALDPYLWAGIVAIATSVLLVVGRYALVQNFSTALVAGFTLITIVNLFYLQGNAAWAIRPSEIWEGMSFRLPPRREGVFPLATALAAFGIIGVGATELVYYPYWCLEKGYARFVGPRDESPEWAERAAGWLRVMRWDAWCSMVIYTFSTIAFYLLGAAILGRMDLVPAGSEMIRTLSAMYEPVFGRSAEVLFLFGAFAVLYSTYFVSNASKARVFSDALLLFGVRGEGEDVHRRWVRALCGIMPLLCFSIFVLLPEPKRLILIAGVAQSIMLPMISFAAIYFRYRHSDARLAPGKLWDLMLWVSALGMLVAGGWTALTKLFPALQQLG
ncbi:MAG: Nramp family divalent metal transporter [Planctomycetales bacterium]|nr:Nramp family divalent metal transporter [Planctomycetales bacterium]